MGVIYKLGRNKYAEITNGKKIQNDVVNDIEVVFYHDKLIVKELDIVFELDREDIIEIIEEENVRIKTILGYEIVILKGIVENEISMIDYLKLHLNKDKILNKDSIRVDTLNGVSTIKMNSSTITFQLKKIEELLEDKENLYFRNKSILFEKIVLPKSIFDSETDKEKFLNSLKLKQIKVLRMMKKLFLK
ncbi:MAG: hypothetical protein ACRCWG_03655 [Sarcina sp.]